MTQFAIANRVNIIGSENMIYGIGADLVDPARITKLLEKHGERFAKRVLTEDEWENYKASAKPISFLASRFAAKEAFSKAVGTGFRHPVSLSNIGITNDDLGKPVFSFHPALADWLDRKGIVAHHLTLTDETNVVGAFVILEKG